MESMTQNTQALTAYDVALFGDEVDYLVPLDGDDEFTVAMESETCDVAPRYERRCYSNRRATKLARLLL